MILIHIYIALLFEVTQTVSRSVCVHFLSIEKILFVIHFFHSVEVIMEAIARSVS